MKSHKLAALAAALTLSAVMIGSALADTVPGSVYGDTGTGLSKTETQVEADLTALGIADVEPTYWAAGSLTVLVESGLLSVAPGGSIAPEATVKADEGIAVFAKVLGLASKTDSTADAVAKFQQGGLLPAGFSTTGEMTRLQVAKLLATALGVEGRASVTEASYPFADFDVVSAEDRLILAALYDLGIFSGYSDGSFGAADVLTRAQIAVLVDRILGAQ